MKRILTVFLSLAILLSFFTACGNSSSDDGLSKENGLPFTNHQEPLNAQNFVSRFIDSDGFMYCINRSYFDAIYFEGGTYRGTSILDFDTLSFDYTSLTTCPKWYFEVYNDSHFSTFCESTEHGIYSYTLAYSDPESRYIVFLEDDYNEEDYDDLNKLSHFLESVFIGMNKETMKSFYKGMSILSSDVPEAKAVDPYYFFSEETGSLYPTTIEGYTQLINDCLAAAN